MKQRRKQEVKAAAADSWHNETETREMKRKNKCCSSVKRFVARGVWRSGSGRQFGKLSVTKAFTFDAFFVAFDVELFSVFLSLWPFDLLLVFDFLFVNNTIQWRINRIGEQLCSYSLHKHNYIMFIFEHFNVMLIKVEFCFIWRTSESAEVAGEYLIFIVPSAALSAFLRGSLSS